MAKNIYVGVGGKARHVKALYVGVGGKARKVKKIYVGVGGKARLAYTAYIPVTSISLKSWDLNGKANDSKSSQDVINTYFNISPDNSTTKDVKAEIVSQTYNWQANDDGRGKIYVSSTSGNYVKVRWYPTQADNTAKMKVWIDNAVCYVTLNIHVKPLWINFRYTWSVY